MEISLALILDELGLEVDGLNAAAASRKFKSVEMFAGGETRYSPDVLLVSPLSEAVAADRPDGTCFLCSRDSTNGQRAPGIVVARGEIGLCDLFNRVQRVFVKITNWVVSMERSIAKRAGLQDLLDLSEPIFRNFITIQDATFKLIAFTKNIMPPGEIMGRLVHHGFHPPETMDLLRRHRRLEEFKISTDIIVNRDRVTSEFDVVVKSFHLSDSIFFLAVMECCNKPATPGVVEMFGLFSEYLRVYSDFQIAETGDIAGVKALVVDILEKSAGSEETARIRSTYCAYPFEGGFRLNVFTFQDENNVPVAQIVRLLTESCRNAVSMYWSRRILILEQKKSDPSIVRESAERILNGIDYMCGISDCFESLWELPVAFEQAVIASDIAAQIVANGNIEQRGRFHLFSDNLIYHVVCSARNAAPDVFRASSFASCISSLRAYDDQHRTETMRILRLYLENERNATSVAAALHMHRNTVLYHMEKINDILGFSLDNLDTRLMLLLAFKADDLHYFWT